MDTSAATDESVDTSAATDESVDASAANNESVDTSAATDESMDTSAANAVENAKQFLDIEADASDIEQEEELKDKELHDDELENSFIDRSNVDIDLNNLKTIERTKALLQDDEELELLKLDLLLLCQQVIEQKNKKIILDYQDEADEDEIIDTATMPSLPPSLSLINVH